MRRAMKSKLLAAAFALAFAAPALASSGDAAAGKKKSEPCKACHGEGHLPIERTLQIKIPPGVDTGSQLRIGGEGEPGALGGPPGDLYVALQVVLPPTDSERQRRAWEQMQREFAFNPRAGLEV